MRSGIKFRILPVFYTTGILSLALLSACASESSSAPVVSTVPVETQTQTPEELQPVSTVMVNETTGGSPDDVIVYASELPRSALSELDFYDDPASPGSKLIGLPNNGDELDPPPENDPHLTFSASVQSGIPYRCWVHLKVGEAKGRSTANVVWVQFSDSVNQSNREVFRPGTNSYLTAQGPTQPGWTWVGCDAAGSDSLVYFPNSGEITVRIQAGAEGVGIDQFVLSPVKYLNAPPSEVIVEK